MVSAKEKKKMNQRKRGSICGFLVRGAGMGEGTVPATIWCMKHGMV